MQKVSLTSGGAKSRASNRDLCYAPPLFLLVPPALLSSVLAGVPDSWGVELRLLKAWPVLLMGLSFWRPHVDPSCLGILLGGLLPFFRICFM